MSERWATACRGKRRYNSMRKAEAAAKSSQIVYGVPMNAYGPCEFCHKWHVGNTFADNGKRARMERIGEGEPEDENNCLQMQTVGVSWEIEGLWQPNPKSKR